MKTAVAVSGGVDSGTALYLLKKRGADLTAVFTDHFKCRTEGGPSCCSRDALRKARQTAEYLKVPFYEMDFREEFKKDVINRFLDYYNKGLTPNPCVWCNRKIRFGAMARRLFSMGFDRIATGHYAKTDGGRLFRGTDRKKDQSYFLYSISRDVLEKVDFPLGQMTKSSVVEIASEAGIPAAESRESQDCCILMDGTLSAYLSGSAELKKGSITDSRGNRIGEHGGFQLYTPGQRRGIGAHGSRKYVTEIVPEENRIIVGDEKDLMKTDIIISFDKRQTGIRAGDELGIRLRSTHGPVPCVISNVDYEKERCSIRFDQPQRSPAPGQCAVLYNGDEVVGGGEIIR